MSDDLDGRTDNEGQEATPADNPELTSRPGVTKPDTLKAILTAAKNRHREFFAGLRGSSSTATRRRRLALKVFLAMLIFPAAAVLLGYITRPASETKGESGSLIANSSEGVTGEKKAKPAPGKPLLTKAEIPAPSVAPQAPAPALPMQTPDGMGSLPQSPVTASASAPSSIPRATAPPAPATVTKPPYTPAVFAARHDKHFGESCAGQLTLDGSGLVFKCFDDPRGSVQVALNEIESVDANGVRLTSGKKYHFSISGMEKSSEEELFANWFHRVR
jgi:hypothetical protein